MYSIDTTQVLEIEVTNYCNAFCGDCDRNIQGGQLNKDLNLQHMSLETWRKIIPKKNSYVLFSYFFLFNIKKNI